MSTETRKSRGKSEQGRQPYKLGHAPHAQALTLTLLDLVLDLTVLGLMLWP